MVLKKIISEDIISNYDVDVDECPGSPKTYRKIPNISPGLIAIFKHIFGGLFGGAYIYGGLIFDGHFVLVFKYQNFEIY